MGHIDRSVKAFCCICITKIPCSLVKPLFRWRGRLVKVYRAGQDQDERARRPGLCPRAQVRLPRAVLTWRGVSGYPLRAPSRSATNKAIGVRWVECLFLGCDCPGDA
jgi:hypothetical protein